MRYPTIVLIIFLFFFFWGCNTDDDSPQPIITSFSGTILFEPTNEPVTNANLYIIGRDFNGIAGSIVRADTILRIDNGTFEVRFETYEKVDRFDMFIRILQDESIINTFVAGSDPPLQCLPGDCDNFAAGQEYELTILVPCSPDDCVLFPPSN
jgi:hypothetical protein